MQNYDLASGMQDMTIADDGYFMIQYVHGDQQLDAVYYSVFNEIQIPDVEPGHTTFNMDLYVLPDDLATEIVDVIIDDTLGRTAPSV